jgi:hypothetical protein
MKYKSENEMQPLYEHLKNNYFPSLGNGYFFDLNQELYIIHLLSQESGMIRLVSEFRYEKKPYAIINFPLDGEPTFFFHGVIFCKHISLINGKIIKYRKNIPLPEKISLEDVKMDLSLLSKQLTNGKAS